MTQEELIEKIRQYVKDTKEQIARIKNPKLRESTIRFLRDD